MIIKKGSYMSHKSFYQLFDKKIVKTEKKTADEDDVMFIEEVTKNQISNDPPIKLENSTSDLQTKQPEKNSAEPIFLSLQDFKKELTEEDDDNLLNQFFSHEQEFKYDSDDDETIFHKSIETDDVVMIQDKNIDDDEDEDEDIKFLKDNEIFLTNIGKTLIDLTCDDDDDDDDEKCDADGFKKIFSSNQCKAEPKSPIVLKAKTISKSISSSSSSSSSSSPLVLRKNNNNNKELGNSSIQKMFDFTNNKEGLNTKICIAVDDDSSDSSDVRLTKIATEFERKHKNDKTFSITPSKDKENQIEIINDDESSEESDVPLFVLAAKQNSNSKKIILSPYKNKISPDKTLTNSRIISIDNESFTSITNDENSSILNLKPCKIVLTPLEKSIIEKYEYKGDIVDTDEDELNNNKTTPKASKKYKFPTLSSDEEENKKESQNYDDDELNKKSYLKNVSQKVSSKPPPGSSKKLRGTEKFTKKYEFPSMSSDEDIIIENKQTNKEKSPLPITIDLESFQNNNKNESNDLTDSNLLIFNQLTSSSDDSNDSSSTKNTHNNQDDVSSVNKNTSLSNQKAKLNPLKNNNNQRVTILIKSPAQNINRKRSASPFSKFQLNQPAAKRSNSVTSSCEPSSNSERPRSSIKITKLNEQDSLNKFNPKSKSKLTITPLINDVESSILNPMDEEKRKYLNSNTHKLKTYYSNMQPKSSKAMEDLRNLKSKETLALFSGINQKNKKNTTTEMNLTQIVKLAKHENETRLGIELKKRNETIEKINSDIPKNTSNKNLTEENPGYASPQPVISKLSKPPLTKAIQPLKHALPNATSISKPHSTSIKTVEKSSVQDSEIDKNDIVSKIINNINKQNGNVENKKPVKKTYKLADFLNRINAWRYDWLLEQQKILSNNRNELPPIINYQKELFPIVDKFKSYDDYYKTMFPLLLLETWEEITKAWRDLQLLNERKNEKKSNFQHQDAPILLKSIEKLEEQPIMQCQFVFQIPFEQNRNITLPNEDDLLRLKINVQEEKSTKAYPSNLFGIVVKKFQLRNEDPPISEAVREYIKQKLGSKPNGSEINYSVMEIHVLSKSRKYQIRIGSRVDYEIITSLSSTLRRVKALIEFRECPIRKHLLQPNILDQVFWINRELINKCGGKEFRFKPINEFNPSQQTVIMEASAIVNCNEPKLYFIQGPPGTGKSTTIVAILNAIISRIECLQSQVTNGQHQHFKLLICSPSNGGCDELTRKIISVRKAKSYLKKICNREILIVRVGRQESIHKDSDEFSLEYLTKKKYDELVTKSQIEKTSSLNEQYTSFVNMENMLDKKIRLCKLSATFNEKQIQELENQKLDLSKRKQKFEFQLKKNSGIVLPYVRRKLEQQAKEMILREADIIISTLNFCGNSIMDCLTLEQNKDKCILNLLIIDEAAQSLEVDSLIPLRFGCNKIIQVGDPEQLPATVFSKKAQDNAFSQSLFERIYQSFRFSDNNPIKMLYVQYRMHPEICSFPSKNFYKGKLVTNENTIKERKSVSLEPYILYDLKTSQEMGDENNGGLYNPKEADFVLGLCKNLIKENTKNTFSIGIITPYQRQVKYLKDLFVQNRLDRVEIGTVDSYQGREKNIIIFSSVRAKNSDNKIGFLTNRQRLNVSLTRAKNALYIVCHADTLIVNEDWKKCIEDAKQRNLLRIKFA